MRRDRHLARSSATLDDILPDTGVCALIDGEQIAMFRVGDAVFALDNYDPNSGANVLVARHRRRPAGRAGRGLADLQAAFQPAHRPLPRRRRSVACAPGPRACSDGRVWVKTRARSRAAQSRRRAGGRRQRHGRHAHGRRAARSSRPRRYDITVFGAEPHGNYNRILLSPRAGRREADRRHHAASAASGIASNGITLHTGDPVVAIDRAPARRAARAAASKLHYDRLLLATGSDPDRAAGAGQGPAGRRHVPRSRRTSTRCSRPRARTRRPW